MYNYLRVNRLMVRLFAEGFTECWKMPQIDSLGLSVSKNEEIDLIKMRHILIVFLNCAREFASVCFE